MNPLDRFYSEVKAAAADVRTAQSAELMVRAFVEVTKPSYVPAGMVARTIIDGHRFTAEFPAIDLERIQRDVEVKSIQAGSPFLPKS